MKIENGKQYWKSANHVVYAELDSTYLEKWIDTMCDSEHPWEFEEYQQDSLKVNLWCGLMVDEVLRPFFFAEKTVNGITYLDLLKNVVFPQIRHQHPYLLFQQDGAPAHWHLEVRNTLDEEFPQRWIGRGGPIPWPPRSPDITPLDFFLWGYVKDKVYSNKVTNMEQLHERIRAAIETVTPQLLQATWREIEYRLDILRATRGAHIEMVWSHRQNFMTMCLHCCINIFDALNTWGITDS